MVPDESTAKARASRVGSSLRTFSCSTVVWDTIQHKNHYGCFDSQEVNNSPYFTAVSNEAWAKLHDGASVAGRGRLLLLGSVVHASLKTAVHLLRKQDRGMEAKSVSTKGGGE